MADREARLRRALERAQAALTDQRAGTTLRAYRAACERATTILTLALRDGGGPEPLVLTLGLPPRELCGNGKVGKYERAELVKETRLAAELEGRRAHRTAALDAGQPDPDGPWFPEGRVGVALVVRRDPLWSRMKLDDDNIQRGLKPALDGLQDAGIVANDRQFYFDGKVVWEKGQPFGGRVTLTLRLDR